MFNEYQIYLSAGGDNLFVGALAMGETDSGKVSFQYADEFLKNNEAFPLAPDLPFVERKIESCQLFSVFQDAGPDSWGSANIQRDYDLQRRNSGLPLQKLDFFQILGHVLDYTRQGALRFSVDNGKTFIKSTQKEIPTVSDLENYNQIIKDSLSEKYSDLDIALLGAYAGSAGGAYPKVNIASKRGNLAMAKFQGNGITKEISAPEWEAVCLQIAKNAGIPTSEFDLLEIEGDYVLVVDRFDRGGEFRIPYISAYTALELQDNNNPESVSNSSEIGLSNYETFANITRHNIDRFAEGTAKELFKRVTLNILVSNTDDHFKNHGFLYKNGKWHLSPVFDVNPIPYVNKEGTPLTDRASGKGRTTQQLLETVGAYGLQVSEACDIIRELKDYVGQWKSICRDFGFSDEKIRTRESAFKVGGEQ